MALAYDSIREKAREIVGREMREQELLVAHFILLHPDIPLDEIEIVYRELTPPEHGRSISVRRRID